MFCMKRGLVALAVVVRREGSLFVVDFPGHPHLPFGPSLCLCVCVGGWGGA